ncbi:MAG: twin-arginine translocase subunit TatC [Verrucomicrobiota bacterium]
MILDGALKKLFRLREKSASRPGADDGYDPAEMPFLDHLEDLRKMFFKIILTLIIAMIVCFTFNDKLLDWIRLPMQWANIGGGGPAFFVSDNAKDEEEIKVGDWVGTRGGMIGIVRNIDLNTRIYRVALGTSDTGEGGIDVLFRKSAIQTKLQKSVDKKKDGDGADDGEADGGDDGSVAADGGNDGGEADGGDGGDAAADGGGDGSRPDPPELKTEEETVQDLLRQQNFLVMEVFQPYEALVLTLKLAFFVGLVLSFPLVTYFVAQFVLPGLRQHEKKVIFPALSVAFVLFLVGASFAFTVGLPMALNFLADYTVSRDIDPGWRIGYYIRFVTQVCLVFGLCFELPVVVLVLVKLELLTYRTMRDSRAYAIVILMIISAIFTPPDPMTLVLLSVPLVVLYEICIWIAYFMERNRLKREKEEERRREEERQALEDKVAALPPGEEGDEDSAAADANEKIIDAEEVPDVQQDPHLSHDYGPDHDEHGNYIGHDHDPHGHGDYDDHYHGHHGHGTMIDINNCSIEEIQQLPGVGPKLAERIMDSRPFYSEDELEYHAYIPESVRKLIVDKIYYG